MMQRPENLEIEADDESDMNKADRLKPEDRSQAARVKSRLDALQTTASAIEAKLGKKDYLGQLLRGEKKTIAKSQLAVLAGYLSTSVDYLLGLSDEPIAAPYAGPVPGKCVPRRSLKAVSPSTDLDPSHAKRADASSLSDVRSERRADRAKVAEWDSEDGEHRDEHVQRVFPLSWRLKSPLAPGRRGLRCAIPLIAPVQNREAWCIRREATETTISRPFQAVGVKSAFALVAGVHCGVPWLSQDAQFVITPGHAIDPGDLFAAFDPVADDQSLRSVRLFRCAEVTRAGRVHAMPIDADSASLEVNAIYICRVASIILPPQTA